MKEEVVQPGVAESERPQEASSPAWRTMESAPRNGLSIIVGDDDVGEFIMHWNPEGENPLVQAGLGIWEATDGSFTWTDRDGNGPSYWRPLVGSADAFMGAAPSAAYPTHDGTRTGWYAAARKSSPNKRSIKRTVERRYPLVRFQWRSAGPHSDGLFERTHEGVAAQMPDDGPGTTPKPALRGRQ